MPIRDVFGLFDIYDFAEFAVHNKLLYIAIKRAVTQNVRKHNLSTEPVRGISYGDTVFYGCRGGLFKQNIVAEFERLKSHFLMLRVLRANKHRIGDFAACKKIVRGGKTHILRHVV